MCLFVRSNLQWSPSNGANSNQSKRQSIGKTGVSSNGNSNNNNSYFFMSNVEGLAKTDVYLYGIKGQEDKFLKTTKAVVDWVGTSTTYGNDMHKYLTKKEEPQFLEPPEPQPAKEGDSISTAQMERYKMKLKQCIDDEKSWAEQKGRMFRTIQSISAPPMRNAFESDPRFEQLYADHDVNGLLALIKEKVYGTDERKELLWITAGAMVKLHTMQQGPQESTANFHKRFYSQVEVTESVWGALIPQVMKGKPTDAQEKAKRAYHARLFLKCLNKNNQGAVNELSKAYINGRSEYPKDLEAALTWITEQREADGDSHDNNTKPSKSNSHGNNDDGTRNATSFTQVAKPATSDDTANNPPSTSSTISISRAKYKMRKPGLNFTQFIRKEASDEEE